jgi:cytosine/adenosine deaminase-related metal-dependent hydrolase
VTIRAQHVVLEHGRLVHHGSIERRRLTITGRCIGAELPGGFRVDLRDHFIFPGLINAHDHLQLNAIPRLATNGTFANSYEWIDAMERHRRDAAVAGAIDAPKETRLRHGGLKNLLAGATTVVHHDPWHVAFEDPEFAVHVPPGLHWCHSLRLGTAADGTPARYGPSIRESFAAAPAAHPWVIHLAEGTDDVAARELDELDALGCLASNTVLVHGVGLTGAGVRLAIGRGASVVWCPASNLGMLGRTLDPRLLFAARRLAIGTDSRLSGSRDLLDELRVAAASSTLSASELLRAVTSDASRIFGLACRGALVPRRRADCVIIRMGENPYNTLLMTERAQLRAVVRDGKPVIADPDFAGWFEYANIDAVQARLDGAPKLLARHVARPEVVALEPGLELT